MLKIDKEQGSTVLHRIAESKPPRSWHTWLIGRPLQTADAPHQTIGKLAGLAIFASDALSSTAYATQEILFILAAAGIGALGFVFPISIVIVILLTIVAVSYEQIIHAYPDGGGAYMEPLLQYIEELATQRQPNETISIVVPQFVPKRFFTNLLHMQTAWILRAALLFKPGIVITDVPYQVE